MSYNVRNCRGLDDSVSYERIARIITDATPDVVAIQELDSMTTRYPQQDVLGNLAALTGMYPTYAPRSTTPEANTASGCSRQKPLSHRRVPLPCRSEPRSLLIVEFPGLLLLLYPPFAQRRGSRDGRCYNNRRTVASRQAGLHRRRLQCRARRACNAASRATLHRLCQAACGHNPCRRSRLGDRTIYVNTASTHGSKPHSYSTM